MTIAEQIAEVANAASDACTQHLAGDATAMARILDLADRFKALKAEEAAEAARAKAAQDAADQAACRASGHRWGRPFLGSCSFCGDRLA